METTGTTQLVRTAAHCRGRFIVHRCLCLCHCCWDVIMINDFSKWPDHSKSKWSNHSTRPSSSSLSRSLHLHCHCHLSLLSSVSLLLWCHYDQQQFKVMSLWSTTGQSGQTTQNHCGYHSNKHKGARGEGGEVTLSDKASSTYKIWYSSNWIAQNRWFEELSRWNEQRNNDSSE